MPNRSISSSLRSNLFRREDIVWKFLKIVSILAQSLAFCRESCPIVVISALRKEESRSRIRGGEPVFRRRKSVSRDISLTDRFQLVHARNPNDRPTVADFHKTVSINVFESFITFTFFLSFLRPLFYVFTTSSRSWCHNFQQFPSDWE